MAAHQRIQISIVKNKDQSFFVPEGRQVFLMIPPFQNEATMRMVIELGGALREAEQILISSVVNYNQAIGDYSLTLFARGKSPQQIANMLVVKPKPLQPRTSPSPNANAGRMRFGSEPRYIVFT